jgi:hypothetical protein
VIRRTCCKKVQDVAQRTPIITSLFSSVEPTAAARAQQKLGIIVPEALVARDLHIADERGRP